MHPSYDRLELEQPVLLPEEVAALEQMHFRGWRCKVLDATWVASEGPTGLEAALERLSSEASAAIDAGYQYLVVSDRAAGVWLNDKPKKRHKIQNLLPVRHNHVFSAHLLVT